MRARVLFSASLLTLSFAAHATTYRGIVSHITDGDTLWVRPDDGGAAQQIRIDGIDAPEICQTFGPQARDMLAGHVLRKHVTVITKAEDTYHRSVARVHLGRGDVGRWMVVRGYAWSYRFRSDPGPYRREEAKARAQRLGLWQESDPQRPRDFRVQHGSCH